jgi:hypothetical protein
MAFHCSMKMRRWTQRSEKVLRRPHSALPRGTYGSERRNVEYKKRITLTPAQESTRPCQ